MFCNEFKQERMIYHALLIRSNLQICILSLLSLEIVVEPWIESLWNPLEHTLQTVHQPTPTANIQEDSMTHETHSPSAPHDLAVTTTNNRGTAVGESAGNTDPANNTRTCSSVEAVRAQQEPASTDLSTVTCSTVESNSSVVATMIDEVPSFAPSPLLNDSVSDLERRLRHRGSDMLKDTPLSLPTVPPGFLSVKFEEVCNDIFFTSSQISPSIV